jgi:3-oxoacyl-[acyl-carrier protein] reductase
MDLKIKGKKALVLGSSTGLGKSIASALVQEGASVAITARNEELLTRTAQEIGASLSIPINLNQPGESRRLVNSVREKLGSVDILVINTGGPPQGSFSEVTPSMWQESFQGLWISAVEAIQNVLPDMKSNHWGRILIVTSISAKEPLPKLTISNGLRAGLLGLMNSLSREVAADGITVNALLPGYTRTQRLKDLGVDEAKIALEIPARRLGEPEEFAALAAFLASESAGFITGQAIACDGGMLKSI